jgi:hypothetical protein
MDADDTDPTRMMDSPLQYKIAMIRYGRENSMLKRELQNVDTEVARLRKILSVGISCTCMCICVSVAV